MKHFVVKDIDPKKVKEAAPFLKIMNDVSMVVTMVQGPLITVADLQTNEEGTMRSLDKTENGYRATAVIKLENERPVAIEFKLTQGRQKLMDISTTLRNAPYDLGVRLDCEGEDLVKVELEKSFMRTVSYEGEELIKGNDLRIQVPAEEPERVELEMDEEVEPPQQEEITAQDNAVHNDVVNEEPEEDAVDLEIEALSDKVKGSIVEVRQIIRRLNAICHDLTRGRTVDFSDDSLKEEILPNGARIQMIDHADDQYRITFRKGILDEQAEVSFFLEEGDQLIFSVYLSSYGNGKISAMGQGAQITVRKVKDYLDDTEI